MEIRIQKTVYENIVLSDYNIKEVTKKKLSSMLHPGEYLASHNGTMWLAKDEDGWRHGSVATEYIHPATTLELAIYEVIKAI